MYTPPSIAGAIATIRAYLAANGLPALVVPADRDLPAQPVAAVTLCRHCGLAIGSAGAHGACEQHAEERSVER